jgi:hypothetical protein
MFDDKPTLLQTACKALRKLFIVLNKKQANSGLFL